MSVTALTFPAFVDTTSSEQLWQIFNAIQGQVGGQTPVVSGGITGTTSVTAGSITAYVVNVAGLSTLSFSTTTTATGGTIGVYGSIDGVNYLATSYIALTTGGSASSFSAATLTIGQINTVGLNYIAFKATSVTGGSVVITTVGANGVSNVMLDNPLPSGTNVIGGTYSTPNVASGTFGSATVTTSATITGLGATTRKYLQIQNIGTVNPLYITTDGTTATATNGFVLQPNGGSVTWEGSFVPNGAITGFSTTTTCSFLWA